MLTWRSPLSSPERILVYGPQGSGKSAKLLDIARRVPDAMFRVIDNDYSQSCSRLLETSYSDLKNVEPIRCDPDDWEELLARVVEAKRVTGQHDWLSVDSMTPTWQAVQNWYTDTVFDKGIEDYFLMKRIQKEGIRSEGGKEKKSLGAFDGWMDWPVINKQYFRKLYNELLSVPGHVWLTAEGDSLSKEDDGDVLDKFQPFGLKPVGQKRLGFVPSTVLLLKKRRVGSYVMTTVKDRGREEFEDRELGDFFVDYMKEVAGWKPVAV